MQLIRFPKIFALGHRYTKTIWDGPVEITEKVDGSQFKFGLIDNDLLCGSKNCLLDLDNPDKLFAPAVTHVKQLHSEGKLPPDMWFVGETLHRPKHSVLKYGRVPINNIALFGVYDCSDTFYKDYSEIVYHAKQLNIDVVPTFTMDLSGEYFEMIQKLLQTESFLGDALIEGVVIKNYAHDFIVGDQYFPIQCAKYVSEKFKEKHVKDWKAKTHKGSHEALVDSLTTEARWQKAVQHLLEAGQLLGEPKDIGPLMKEVHRDIIEEEEDFIKDRLFKIFTKQYLRKVTHGLPEWYKEQLAKGEINVS
jgi:hypothetical protein